MDTIQTLQQRIDLISAQARDLIEHTQRERASQLFELRQARADADRWRHQAMELELRMREALLSARECEMSRREAEEFARSAYQRSFIAEEKSRKSEAYLEKISDLLTSNLP